MLEMTNIRGQSFNPGDGIMILKKAVSSTVKTSTEIDTALKSIEKRQKEGDKFEQIRSANR